MIYYLGKSSVIRLERAWNWSNGRSRERDEKEGQQSSTASITGNGHEGLHNDIMGPVGVHVVWLVVLQSEFIIYGHRSGWQPSWEEAILICATRPVQYTNTM